jgi:hypothetical protein
MSSSVPAMHFRTFWLPKRGHSVAEYEDACAGDVQRGRFAIADGASESSFAAVWARLLVEDFVHSEGVQPGPWEDWLPALQSRWAAEVAAPDLPWYAEVKVQQGAFATFLGVGLFEVENQPRWYGVAVGDSCLFHMRAGRLLQVFPALHADDFDNTPWLIGSRSASSAGTLTQGEVRGQGDCCPGDRLWLMTDALAQWFLRQVEADGKPWEELEALLTHAAPDEAFTVWVEFQRSFQRLRNDDVTLLAVSL